MSGLTWLPLIGDLLGILDKAVPDATERDRAKAKLAELQEAAMLKQGEIAAAESASPDRFRSWWRPAVGWMCVLGLWLDFIVFPLTSLGMQMAGHAAIASPLDVASLMALLGALLGLGTLRTVERVRDKA